jgi:hypothetical protein
MEGGSLRGKINVSLKSVFLVLKFSKKKIARKLWDVRGCAKFELKYIYISDLYKKAKICRLRVVSNKFVT